MAHRRRAEKLGTLKFFFANPRLSKLNPARDPVGSSSAFNLKLKDIPDVEVDGEYSEDDILTVGTSFIAYSECFESRT